MDVLVHASSQRGFMRACAGHARHTLDELRSAATHPVPFVSDDPHRGEGCVHTSAGRRAREIGFTPETRRAWPLPGRRNRRTSAAHGGPA